MTDEAAESRRPAPTEDGRTTRPPLPGPAPSDLTDTPASGTDRTDDEPTATVRADDEPTATVRADDEPTATVRADDEPTATDLGIAASTAAFPSDPAFPAGAQSAPGTGEEPTLPLPPPAATDRTPPSAGPHPTAAFPAGGMPTEPGGPAAGPGGPAGPGGTPPGPAAPPPWHEGGAPPPPTGSAFTSRYGLVRPRNGRYLAGVCAAIGRATNTDPILWRVLLAVLGFAGGIGILVYLAAWLIIPNEGDTASPVESMLGRGRSSMSPILVIILSVLVAVMFGLIVTDKFRAIVLAAAILVGGALLLNRNSGGRPGSFGPADPAQPPTGPGPPPGWAPPAASFGTVGTPGTPPGPAVPYPTTAATGAPAYAAPPGAYAAAGAAGPPAPPPYAAAPRFPTSPSFPPAAAPGYPPVPPGYRPPFAPHGPYGGRGPQPPAPPRPANPPKPPKPPKQRSPLGAATFSMIFVALGLVAMFDLTNAVAVPPSTYFAAPLVTIALGLLVGAWFGRARWLIALGLVAAAALGVATMAESYSELRNETASVNWQPATYDDLADRYGNRFGDAVLDLRSVDFTGKEAQVTVAVDFGQLDVVLPPEVDVDARVDVKAGDATVFDTRWSGFEQPARSVTDNGADGRGGGKLRLIVHVNAGNVEVYR